MSDPLSAAVETLGLDAAVAEKMERYVRALLGRNASLNLTGAKDAASAVEHVRDSLGLLPHVRAPLVDIGSGGGFPAIPLAIVSGIRMTLVESVLKKARFLEQIGESLELPVSVRATRAEEAARDPGLRESFASATARAVANVTTVLELTVPLLQIGGIAILQRGALSGVERSAAHDAALVLGARIEREFPAGADVDGRCVLLVRKTEKTGDRFPRRAGIPAKRPLCWHRSDG